MTASKKGPKFRSPWFSVGFSDLNPQGRVSSDSTCLGKMVEDARGNLHDSIIKQNSKSCLFHAEDSSELYSMSPDAAQIKPYPKISLPCSYSTENPLWKTGATYCATKPHRRKKT